MRNQLETPVIVLRHSALLYNPLTLFALLLPGMVLMQAATYASFLQESWTAPFSIAAVRLRCVPKTRAAVIASLPRKGEVSDLRQSELRKIAAVRQVLDFHDRAETYVIKIIDVPQAFTGLHERSVLLFSRHAVELLNAEQLQALAAHEIGHEYVWNEYRSAEARTDKARLRELELVCDRIAVATLSQMRLPKSALVSALEKVFMYNREHFGETIDESLYPSLEERRANIARMGNEVAPSGSGDTRVTFFLEKFVVTLNISFPPSFRGGPLSFNPGKQNSVEPCFASSADETPKCPTNFVGAVALAQYSVRQRNGQPARHFSLRERITKIDQHPDFPGHGNEERTAHAVKGIITDVQLFGYDEASLPNAQEREAAKKVWGVYRQETLRERRRKTVRNHSVEA